MIDFQGVVMMMVRFWLLYLSSFMFTGYFSYLVGRKVLFNKLELAQLNPRPRLPRPKRPRPPRRPRPSQQP